ncbi:MAG: UDP-glucose 4-epimerase GalE [Thermodesulfobacteriota bacterium]|nr:MAG: UDP-glucose 4-epimerase GalE [Thermodesulfobacteriota bacterium]
MKILVTGGAGYIGANVSKALKNRGHEVIVFDNLSRGHRDLVRWGVLEEGDLLDKKAVEGVFEKHHPSAVMHFAAYAYVGESVVDPALYYLNNVVGSLNLVDAARSFNVKNFIFSSTCALYGESGKIPITEDLPLNPINPYGNTKLVIEKLLEDFSSAYGLKSVSLRYFNAAGADRLGEAGEDHTPETHLIPLVLDAASARRPDITIYGTDYDTPDGTCVRDYIHVTDLAEAHVLALEYLVDGGSSIALNLGNGTGHSVREVIEAVRKVTGRDFIVNEGARRPGDPPRLIASYEMAKKILGWEPRFGDMETIIRDAWAWHKKRFVDISG